MDLLSSYYSLLLGQKVQMAAKAKVPHLSRIGNNTFSKEEYLFVTLYTLNPLNLALVSWVKWLAL